MTNEFNVQHNQPQGSSVNLWLVVALVGLTGVLAYQTWERNRLVPVATGVRQPREIVPGGKLRSAEEDRTEVFKRTSPSVVFIRTKGFQPYLYGGGKEKELSSGTGFVWDDHGYIVTNLHVVKSALASNKTAMEVQFADGSVVDAELIGGVREHDIAILKVEATVQELKPIELGTSHDLKVGQDVLAIGNPFGFDHTLSTGVIGGLDRSVAAESGSSFLNGLIQTDAAINPGNSGGPLLDSSGRMIGVNTAIVSPTGANSGLGFAVPVSSVVTSVEQVLRGVEGNREPVLGIRVLPPAMVEKMHLPAEIIERGLFIASVDPQGPAAGSSLQVPIQRGYRLYLGDQLAALDGKPVTTPQQLADALADHSPGDVITLAIYRGNDLGEVQIKLQARKLLF